MASIADLFSQAQSQMGTILTITVSNPNRDNAIVRISSGRDSWVSFKTDTMTFDGATGRMIDPPGNNLTTIGKFIYVFAGIHFGFFGGHSMRVLYFLCGASGTIMVACGLVMFTTKRRAMAHSLAAERFYGFVDRMNVAAVAGSLFACAAYFWAVRLLPQSLSSPDGGSPRGVYVVLRAVPLHEATRSDYEVYTFWLAWGLATLYAFVRAPQKAWTEQLAASAALCIGLPVIGYLVPNCDLGSMIAAGDWKMVAVDLSGMSIGLMLAWVAWKVSGKRIGGRVGELLPVLSPAE
jgi:hypothetical protein